ncbi:hypothetical protein SLE2022_039600 [Rubroshorea leprosula]
MSPSDSFLNSKLATMQHHQIPNQLKFQATKLALQIMSSSYAFSPLEVKFKFITMQIQARFSNFLSQPVLLNLLLLLPGNNSGAFAKASTMKHNSASPKNSIENLQKQMLHVLTLVEP